MARRGFRVTIYEMRPEVDTTVHKTGNLAELVCSNSLRSDDPYHPVGLIKREMAGWHSLIIEAARASSLPAGSALAVDREGFGKYITNAIEDNPNITLVRGEMEALPQDGPVIIAAGPLCSPKLSESLYGFLGDQALYFYDAIAPVIEYDSLDLDVIFAQSRYGKGDGDDYLNIPLGEEDYKRFYNDLVNAERVAAKDHEKLIFFEGCLPIEVMADRGEDTLRFGPMKPVGITNPNTGEQPYAVIQLRQDNYAKSHWNLVGFQTQLKWGEQKRILRQLPGMDKAEIVRYGMIHRNTYVRSPDHLEPTFRLRKRPEVFLAGQITGVEGYVESAASGLMAGVNMARYLAGKEVVPFPASTAMGALAHYVSFSGHGNFQPTNVNFGIMSDLNLKKRMRRREKRRMYITRAVADMQQFAAQIEEEFAGFGNEYEAPETPAALT